MYVCLCNPVTEHQVRECVERGACTLSALQGELGVALQCGMCASAAIAIIEARHGPGAAESQQLSVAA